MQNKITPFLFLSLAIAVSTFAPPVTHAQITVGALTDTGGQSDDDGRLTASSSARMTSTTSDERQSATTSEDKGADNRAASTSPSISGQLIAEDHRGTVATFVRSLLAVANQEGGFGEQVRSIAEAQRDSEATTTEAIEKIASRSSIKTLFIGSDYKNLGILRSEMVQTQKHLDQLNAILASTTSATARITLSAQIRALALDQANIQNFVTAHEDSFSFFGWFARLF